MNLNLGNVGEHNMNKIKLFLDFLNGPVWKDVYDIKRDALTTGVAAIDNDTELQRINDAIQQKYSSFYSFSKTGTDCTFDETAFNASKQELLALINQLKRRLNEINNGTFEIEDFITETLSNEA